MSKKTWWIIGSIYIAIMVAMTVIFWVSIFDFEKTNTPFYDELVHLQWYFEGEAVSLPDHLDVETGEAFTITATLPSDVTDIPIMMMRSSKQSVKVTVDDEILYQYDTTGVRWFGKSNYSSYHFIDISSDMAGKTIAITLQSPLASSSGRAYDVEFGTNVVLFQYLCSQNLAQMLISIFLICTGLFIAVSSSVFLKNRWEQKAQVFLGLAAIFIGFWQLFESKMIGLFFNAQLVYLGTYISHMLFTLFFALYIFHSYRQEKLRKISIALIVVAGLNTLLQMLLYMLGVVEMTEINFIVNIIIILEVIVYCWQFVANFEKGHKKPNYIVRLVGASIAIVGFLADFLIYYSFSNVFLPTGLIACSCFLTFLLITHASTIVRTIDDAEKGYIAEKELEKTKRYLMFSQRRPHFIFNTLAAIRALIASEPEVAYDMTTNFSKYLRATMDVENVDTNIPFSKELSLIRAYVDIEKVRFKDRVKIVYDIKESNFEIPSMTIQPLIENAIKHGICKKLEGGTIYLSTYKKDNEYFVEIKDDGVGFNVEHLSTKAKDEVAGLKNIKQRLQDAIGASLQIESKEGEGTCVLVTFKGEEK